MKPAVTMTFAKGDVTCRSHKRMQASSPHKTNDADENAGSMRPLRENYLRMKKIYRLFPAALGLLASVILLFSSCDKMNDIQEQWAGKEEQVYLGKVDSLKFYPGLGRAKITWYIGADPKVDRTIIYWNMRQDSIVKEFVRTGSGLQRDSVILENLPEGSILFEFRNANSEGETSLYSNLTVTVWGQDFASGQRARRIDAFSLNPDESIFELGLTPATVGDNVAYAEVVYTNSSGQIKTVRADRETNILQLTNFPAGGEFDLRTVFFPPQGIDTVYNEFESFRAPAVVKATGSKSALAGNLSSKYFEYNGGESLYEWTSDSKLIAYSLNGDGSVSASGTQVTTVSRETYRDLFFYDANRFIAVTTGNALRMITIHGGAPVIVKTPADADDFGTGFTMPLFMPSSSGVFFYSLTAAGVLQAWYARNDAAFNTPNNVSVGTGYDVYKNKLALFNTASLLAVDEEGNLWSQPVSVSGRLGSKSRIGSGWNRFERIIGVGTTLLCMEENGDFYIFDDFNTTENFWIVD